MTPFETGRLEGGGLEGGGLEGRPRLLLLNYEYPPLGGGAATATRHLIREWSAMGCAVEVLTSHFPGLAREERLDGALIRRLPVGRRRRDRGRIDEMSRFMARAAWAGLAAVRRRRPDAVIAFIGIPAGPPAWLINRLTGVPYVVCLRGGDVPGFRCEGIDAFHRVLAPFTRAMWRRAAAVTANSAGLADLARAFTPDLDIPVIHNGVDATLFHPDPARLETAPDRRVRALVVGRLVAQKGVDVLLDAMARPGVGELTLDIVGDGDWRDRLEAQAARLGLTDRVRFRGWLDREALARVYREVDVLALPSRDEGMPNVVLEAMASGLPVVASRVAGAEDLVVDGETGFLTPPEDAAALAAALERLIGDAAARRRMGAAGRARVEAGFSWRASAAAFLDLLGLDSPGLDSPGVGSPDGAAPHEIIKS